MAKKQKKNIIALECTECKSKNYTHLKSSEMKEKLVKNKYCKKCRKSVEHKETKVK